MSFEVRPVRPEEYAEVGELTASVYDIAGFVPRSEPYSAQLADVAARARDAECWVAVDGDQILGTVTYCAPGSAYREISVDDSEAEFRMLAVAPDARGRGIGETLVRRCVQRAISDGHRRVVISSMSLMTDAARLYARFGFVPLPDRDWSPHDTHREVELLAYVLELG